MEATSETQSAAPSNAEKLEALQVETAVTHQATRDTQLLNEHTHTRISQLHVEADQLHTQIQKEEKEIRELREKLALHRQRNSFKTPGRRGKASLDEEDDAPEEGLYVPIPTLEKEAMKAKKALSMAQDAQVVAHKTLEKVRSYKELLEKDLEHQLNKNAALNENLKKTRAEVMKKCAQARGVSREVSHLEKELQAEQGQIKSLVSEAKSMDRYAERLQNRLSMYSKELQDLHGSRMKSRQLVLDEVEVSVEREKWIEELKQQNKGMLDFLMTRKDLMCNEEEEGERPDGGLNDEATAMMMQAAAARRSEKSVTPQKAKAKKDPRALYEEKMLDEMKEILSKFPVRS